MTPSVFRPLELNTDAVGKRMSFCTRQVAPLGLYALCVMALLNPAVAQAGYYFFPSGIAGMSLMQWFQGLCCAVVLATLPFLLPLWHKDAGVYAKLAGTFLIVLAAVYLRGDLTSSIPKQYVGPELIYYVKILFSLTLWLYVSLVVRTAASARRLMYSIIAGSSICAVIVLYFYLTRKGLAASYLHAGVIASRGAEGVSGKATLGYLLPSLWVTLYLLMTLKKPWLLGVALLLLAASYVMYDRSSQVSFVMAGLWLICWGLGVSRERSRRNMLTVVIAVLAVVAVAYFSIAGFDQLTRRWTYDFDRGQIGSGRGNFWSSSLRWLMYEADLADFVFGMGYGGMKERMDLAVGRGIHTHSDVFDMLLIAGMVGGFLLILMYYSLLRLTFLRDRSRAEFAIMTAIFISYFVMSCITGQIAAPHAMFSVMALLWCVRNQTEPDTAMSAVQ